MASQPVMQQEQQFFPAEPELEFHISQWIEVVRRRLRLAVVILIAAVAVAIALYILTPRTFRATTVIQIDRRADTIATSPQFMPYEDYASAESFYPTQYRLLQSRGLAERVVKNLRLADDPAFNPVRSSLLPGGDRSASAEDDAARLGGLASGVLGGLTINPIRNTRLVEISFVSTSPDVAMKLANGVAEAFIDWGVETRQGSSNRASSFLSSQIETIKQEIQDKENQLQAYGRRSDIVALDPSSNVTLQRLEGLNRDYVQALSERIMKEARYKELMSGPKDSMAESLSGGLVTQLRGELARLERDYAAKLNVYKPEWPAMQELKSQIDKGRQNLQSVTEETVSKAQDTSRAEYQAALRREESLAGEMNRQKSDAMRLNSAAVEYNSLKSEVSTRRSLLDDILRRQSAAEVESRLSGTRNSNVLVVDRALKPDGPFRPSLTRNLMLGIVLGLGLGLGAIFLVEYLDRTIKTPEDVDRTLQLPVLASIPDISSAGHGYGYRRSQGYGYGYGYGPGIGRGSGARAKASRAKAAAAGDIPIELVTHSRSRLAVSETFRSLRTALLLSSADGVKAFAVTSAIPGEGKTSVACNLAVVLAQLGRDVLLVDGDMRKARQHEVFGLSNRVGLVNVLTGTAEAAAVILRTQVPNLYVTPAGAAPPNPAELLSSARMRAFVELARQRFEYVVFDTPPVLPVTDALVVGAVCDGIVLCVGAGGVVREDVRSCRDRLEMGEIKIFGVALNRFRISSGRGGYRYRHYEAYSHSTEEQPLAGA